MKIFIMSILLCGIIYAEEPTTVSGKILSAQDGRYVFGQVSSFRLDRFMLDTKTGRLWQIVMNKDSTICLQIVPYQSYDLKNDKYTPVLHKFRS